MIQVFFKRLIILVLNIKYYIVITQAVPFNWKRWNIRHRNINKNIQIQFKTINFTSTSLPSSRLPKNYSYHLMSPFVFPFDVVQLQNADISSPQIQPAGIRPDSSLVNHNAARCTTSVKESIAAVLLWIEPSHYKTSSVWESARTSLLVKPYRHPQSCLTYGSISMSEERSLRLLLLLLLLPLYYLCRAVV